MPAPLASKCRISCEFEYSVLGPDILAKPRSAFPFKRVSTGGPVSLWMSPFHL